MRSPLPVLLVAAAACATEVQVPATPPPDGGARGASDAGPDALGSSSSDAGPAAPEDLDMTLHDFDHIQGFMPVPGRSYQVANPLGHEAEAIAAGSSPTGGTFPVGSIVELSATEAMVKRRVGFNATTNDWEFFGIVFAADGTAQSFSTRGTENTACFSCHSQKSSPTWDFICEHP
jgi:hypothetical protein